jgi:hypothetical protein
MPSLEIMGRWMVAAGIGLVLLGGLAWLAGHFLPAGKDFPGTIRIQGAGFTCIFPLLASIVISILLTIVLNLLARFMNR